MEENLAEFDYMIINVEFYLNGRLISGVVKSIFYDSNIKLNDTNRAEAIKTVLKQLGGSGKAIATIRYYDGYYTTNIINRNGIQTTVLEYDFNDVIAGDYRFNYWIVTNETAKLIKTI